MLPLKKKLQFYKYFVSCNNLFNLLLIYFFNRKPEVMFLWEKKRIRKKVFEMTSCQGCEFLITGSSIVQQHRYRISCNKIDGAEDKSSDVIPKAKGHVGTR
jgi:hypothetical protein